MSFLETKFQSRLGTTLHSDFLYFNGNGRHANVSIPTGHHTSFRLYSVLNQRPAAPVFQSRLGTTLHSDSVDFGIKIAETLCFNPDWAPHFIPTSV